MKGYSTDLKLSVCGLCNVWCGYRDILQTLGLVRVVYVMYDVDKDR